MHTIRPVDLIDVILTVDCYQQFHFLRQSRFTSVNGYTARGGILDTCQSKVSTRPVNHLLDCVAFCLTWHWIICEPDLVFDGNMLTLNLNVL